MENIVLFLFYAFVSLLPFERIPTFEAGGFTVKISYIFFILLAIGFLVLYKKSIIKRVGWDIKLLAALWLFALISTLFYSSNLTRGLIILSMWAFSFAVYFVSSNLTKNHQEKIKNLIIVSAIITSFFGLYQFIADSVGVAEKFTLLSHHYTKAILGFPRAQSVALEPLYFANFLFAPIFITFGYFINKDNKIFNKYSILQIILLAAFILAVSRGAYIAMAVSVLGLIAYLIIIKKPLKLIGCFISIALALAISFLCVKVLNGTKASQGAIDHSVVYVGNTDKDSSALDRIGTYKLAFKYFKEKPLLGNGLASFGTAVTPENKKKDGIYQTVNNQYLELLTENGIVGLLIFLAFLIFLLIQVILKAKSVSIKSKNSIVMLSLAIFAILVQYNFFSTLYIVYIWAFLGMLKGEVSD